MVISNSFPPRSGGSAEAFYVIAPGRLKVGLDTVDDPFAEAEGTTLSITPEQSAFFEGTVLHSLVNPNQIMYLDVERNGSNHSFPIPPIKLTELEPRAAYDSTRAFVGTMLRLPGLYVYANAVQFHTSQGRPPALENLYLSYAGDMTRIIDKEVLRTRIAPGISAIAMGGDTFLLPGQIGITRTLAADLLSQVQDALPREDRIRLSRRRSEHGDYILSGYNMVVLRNPTTVYGACRQFSVVIVDSPGAAIYMRSPDIDLAGGDFDGDMLFAFDSKDLTGRGVFEYCMSSTPHRTVKYEDFSVGSIVARKKGISRRICLTNLTWTSEKELNILAEFKEKSLIGKAWYALVHYDFLTAHFIPSDSTKKQTLDKRLALIKEQAQLLPGSLLEESYNEFNDAYPDPDWNDKATYKKWVTLAYRAISDAFFPIYELIFDLRKGEGKPPYRPNEAISALMGYSDSVDWNGMKAGGVWTEIIQAVYEDLPRAFSPSGGVQVDIRQALADFPAFYHLVNRRRELSASEQFSSVQQLGIYMEDSDTFAKRLVEGLLYGTPL